MPRPKICSDVDLRRSLELVFGGRSGAAEQIETDEERQRRTAEDILDRFFADDLDKRRELIILADEVGLGKTFVALTVAVSVLDAIRQDEAPDDLPVQRPTVLVLTPNNDALYNKWRREAATFQSDCARPPNALSWYEVGSPIDDSSRAGNVIDLTEQLRSSTRGRPRIVVAKIGVFGSKLHETDEWRRNALACAFRQFGLDVDQRERICRKVLGSGSQANVPELLDLRRSGALWNFERRNMFSADLRAAYERALRDRELSDELHRAISDEDADRIVDWLDVLTRSALVWDWPLVPLVIIDEVHHLKNESTATRRNLERYLRRRTSRLLGLSATPFQLHHDELLSVLGLHDLVDLTPERREALQLSVDQLRDAMSPARQAGDRFREAWMALRSSDGRRAHELWARMEPAPRGEWTGLADASRPPRVARAFRAAAELERCNRQLEKTLRPFVIRHRHDRAYRQHWVGRNATAADGAGSPRFSWAPGMEVTGDAELVHYLLMRAVSLAKDEKGRAGLGAELTGSYRHLVETSATWKMFGTARNLLLPTYRKVLERCLRRRDADRAHPKLRATADRALKAFENGQKTLIFCVFVKTAEAVRDELQNRIREALAARREMVFGSEERFEGFRKRFFNRREPLYSLIQDHPLIGRLPESEAGIPEALRLGERELREVTEIVLTAGEEASVEKPDRRLLLAAVEHVAVRTWLRTASGRRWLDEVLPESRLADLREAMSRTNWVPRRASLAASVRARDPEAAAGASDPLLAEEGEEVSEARRTTTGPGRMEAWLGRLRREPVGVVVAPYFRPEVLGAKRVRGPLPLLPRHHSDLLVRLDTETRRTAGVVFRRILMAEEFLLRYLADAPREKEELWGEYLTRRYTEALRGHRESLRDRVHAYFETLVRAMSNAKLVEGYREAATNLNVVQLVRGGMKGDRYFLGFNTPYRPEILVATSVGQEGIDLHRECRHVVHHDLCWNPATVEQRTGRVDRIGSKVERERAEASEHDKPTLDIGVPYLAATYDERMFEALYRRAQLFEVTMGGDFRVEGRIVPEEVDREERRRNERGIGTPDEDLGEESESGAIDLPASMVERLRVDLAVWKPRRDSKRS